jgi:hypothetical protein
MSFDPAGGVGLDPNVPAPPPGPGAAPPFAAPPTDRNKRGLWIGLIVGGLALVLCCVGGVFGIGVLVVGSTEQAKNQATTSVTNYLNATHDGDWEAARRELCSRLAARYSAAQLEAQEAQLRFTSYTLDEPVIADAVEVLAHLNTSSGEVQRLFLLDTEGTRLAICGIR